MTATVTVLHQIADRLARLRVDPRNIERFLEERSELVAALRAAALPEPCSCKRQVPATRQSRSMTEAERARRWAALLKARESETRPRSAHAPVDALARPKHSPAIIVEKVDPRPEELARRAMRMLATERAERTELEKLLDQARRPKPPRKRRRPDSRQGELPL